MSKKRAADYERVLVNRFWDSGFAVMRAPSSSGTSKMPRPDVLAGSATRGLLLALEIKTSRQDVFYVQKEQIEGLIKFAERLGAKLLIIGPQDKSSYFDDKIKPRLSHKIQYIPAINNSDKWHWMATAKAVIFPSVCEEGDPNVPKEALAVGTPVIALDGTVSEIVDDRLTGIVCQDVNEMLDRHREVLYMNPYMLRQTIEQKCGVDVYIDKTLRALQKAIDGDVWL